MTQTPVEYIKERFREGYSPEAFAAMLDVLNTALAMEKEREGKSDSRYRTTARERANKIYPLNGDDTDVDSYIWDDIQNGKQSAFISGKEFGEEQFIDSLLSEFKRQGFDTSNWDGDEGAEKAIVDGVVRHIEQRTPSQYPEPPKQNEL